VSTRWQELVRPRKRGQKSFIIDHPQGWAIMPIHYSMFEASTAEWVAEQQRVYTDPSTGKTDDDWEQEMEINMELVSGTRCYPDFRWEVNTRHEVPFDSMRPLRVCCDFNVAIKAWPVVQKIHGRFYQNREIARHKTDATIPKMCAELRRIYPAHPGGIMFYGDATGNQKGHGADNESYWDLIRIAMNDYPSEVEFSNVPEANPPAKLRINSLNASCKGHEGEPILIIHRGRCHYTISDFLEVVWDDNGKYEKQISDTNDPKHLLTHATAGLGYMMAVERPVSELADILAKRKERKGTVDLRKGEKLGRL
jgi:hypothetical protein